MLGLGKVQGQSQAKVHTRLGFENPESVFLSPAFKGFIDGF